MSSNPPHKEYTRKDFSSDQEVRWCPGCGDYAILAAMQRTLPSLGSTPENTVFISGIGCSSRFPYYMNTYGFHTIHGRAPAFATGLKLANPELDVWVITGDGDGLSIGGNHLLHVLRRNIDLQILLFNNQIYGLTKGQYSPTSQVGIVTPSSPLGSIDQPIVPVRFALGARATFVARAFDTSKRLPESLSAAREHKGASFIEILQNCPVFNDGVWEAVENRKSRATAALVLEHGEPLVFGAPGQRQGIVFKDGIPSVIDLDDADDPIDRGVVVHDERPNASSYAGVLATLRRPDFPMPVGVFRAVEKPTYEEMLQAQVDSAIAERGRGDLKALLHSGDTWEI